MCRLIESIQIKDGELKNLRYHQERMNRSSQALFGKQPEFSLHSLIIPEDAQLGIIKCRIVYNIVIEKVEFQSYEPRKINSLKLIFDDTVLYNFKYEDRTRLDEMLKQKGTSDDILLVKNGKITDTSYSNVVFRKGSSLYTPDTFLLNGTRRIQLLEEGIIQEKKITVEEMQKMDSLILINAMLDIKNAPEIKISSILF